uniref:Uncharacterized protein n=1 Tax=Vespula pensylvanica TaxID=30213 RepID=A0A834K044_VESPE|nr:hypothetical protein H0235_016389 [Vespula pensylvanica]
MTATSSYEEDRGTPRGYFSSTSDCSIALILLSDRHLRPDLRRLRYTGGKGDGSKSADEKAAVPVGVANLAPVREGWIARTTRNCYRYASTRFPVSFDVSQPQTVPTVDYRST